MSPSLSLPSLNLYALTIYSNLADCRFILCAPSRKYERSVYDYGYDRGTSLPLLIGRSANNSRKEFLNAHGSRSAGNKARMAVVLPITRNL